MISPPTRAGPVNTKPLISSTSCALFAEYHINQCAIIFIFSSPNTNDLYIHYMDKSTGTPSLEEKKALPNCANKEINVLINGISTSVAPVLTCMK